MTTESTVRVRQYPSGMIEVTGSNVAHVAQVAGEMAYRSGPKSSQRELPLEEPPKADSPSVPETKLNGAASDGPFYDAGVCLTHPAIIALARYVSTAQTGTKFEYHWMRIFIGKHITGTARECHTRAVGTLMGRLEKGGIVSRIDRNHWQKVARVDSKGRSK